MKFSNLQLGQNVEIDPSTSINNIIIKNNVRIAKRCSIFGGPDNLLEIGENTYVGMNTIINGFVEKVIIGSNVSIAQSVSIICDSGPNASVRLQRLFPLEKAPIKIGDDCWIGAFSISRRASNPLATPIQCLAPVNATYSSSNNFTSSPNRYQPELTTF